MPYFCDITKTTSDLSKLKHVLNGVIAHGRGSYIYTSTMKCGKGCNVTVELLQLVLTDLDRDGRGLPPVLFLQMDNCGSQNKNHYVFGYLAWLVSRGVFREIYVSFLPVGHTHADIDQMFSRFSVYLRCHDAPCRAKLYRGLAESFTPAPSTNHIRQVCNFKKWLDDNKFLHKMIGIAEPLHFKLVRLYEDTRQVHLFTKNSCDSPYWYGTPDNNTAATHSVTHGWCIFNTIPPSPHPTNPFVPPIPDFQPMQPPTVSIHDRNRSTTNVFDQPGRRDCTRDPKAHDEYVRSLYGFIEQFYEERRFTEEDLKQCEADIEELFDLTPVPFHWYKNGCFTGEIEQINKRSTNKLYSSLQQYDKDALIRLENAQGDIEHDYIADHVRKGIYSEGLDYRLVPLDRLQSGEFILRSTRPTPNDPSLFWIAQVSRKYIDPNTAQQMVDYHWYESQDTSVLFGKYNPSYKITKGRKTARPSCSSCRISDIVVAFSKLTKAGRIPLPIQNYILSQSEILEDANEQTQQQIVIVKKQLEIEATKRKLKLDRNSILEHL
jgi:hypothetical protein